jgi:hypothetical protein
MRKSGIALPDATADWSRHESRLLTVKCTGFCRLGSRELLRSKLRIADGRAFSFGTVERKSPMHVLCFAAMGTLGNESQLLVLQWTPPLFCIWRANSNRAAEM